MALPSPPKKIANPSLQDEADAVMELERHLNDIAIAEAEADELARKLHVEQNDYSVCDKK